MWTWIFRIGFIVLLVAGVAHTDELKTGEPKTGVPTQEELTPQRRQKLEEIAARCLTEGLKLYRSGKRTEALQKFQQELEIRRQLCGEKDHTDLAQSLNNIGFLLKASGRLQEALPLYQEALLMVRRLYSGQDHLSVAESLNNMGSLLGAMGQRTKALRFHEESLAMTRRLYEGQDHPALARSLNNTGLALKQMGRIEKALPHYADALAMRKRLYQDRDHADVASSLNNMGLLLHGLGRRREALPLVQDALAMQKRLHKDRDHPLVASSLISVGSLYEAMGRYENALIYYETSSAMFQRLFQNRDHPHMATILNNLGSLLQVMGRRGEALTYYRNALAMRQRLYGERDHPELASSLNNTGLLFRAMGRYEEALPFATDALAMQKRLHKERDHADVALSLIAMGSLLQAMEQYEEALPFRKGALAMQKRLHFERDHPHLAISLNDMGSLLAAMGRPEEALPFLENALAMAKRIYRKSDHPHLAKSLNNMGFLLAAMERHVKATAIHREALAMQVRIGQRSALTGGLAETIAQIATLPDSRSALLSASQRAPTAQESAYDSVWKTKAALARLFRTRRGLAHTENPKKLSDRLGELAVIQQQISGILASPTPAEKAERRNRRLGELTDQQRRIEKQIAGLLPDDARPVDLKLADLTGALQSDEVFIDLYRYFDRTAPKDARARRYVAFVVAAGRKPQRVELHSIEPIDAAVREWREALHAWSPDTLPDQREDLQRQSNTHAETLRRLIWAPIARRLPDDTKRIFISPDGDLGRVPFAALPGDRPGSALLESYSIAVVESGPHLLEHLAHQGDRRGNETLVALGGVRYDMGEDPAQQSASSRWPYLTGTESELRQVTTLWGSRGKSVISSGREATTGWLLEKLPTARYAHLATHGQFRAREFAEEQRVLEQSRQNRIASVVALRKGGSGSRPSTSGGGLGVRNPLAYVGLVMAGANDPSKSSPDRGILAGTSIWPLELSNLELAVLSACETGLGEYTRDAGVQNLALALHVAGCRNVIASLWKVNDEATAALMVKFYHELWVNEKPIIDALREAQLLVYRRPDLIPDLAGSRGALKLKQSLTEKPTTKAVKREGWPSRTPPKYWAAFVLSGAGK